MADVITRLKLESGEYDSKIKRAVTGLQQMERECRSVNGTLAKLEKDQLDYVQSLGRMETVSTSARGKLAELTSAFTELRMQYKGLSDEEKRGDFGRALSSSLDQLKQRIRQTKSDLEGVNRELNGSGSKFGQLGDVVNSLGSRFGVAGNLTEMLTSRTALMTGAVGASIAVIGKATSAWASYNSELARQDQITEVTTQTSGPSAERMTDAARAMVDTYGVDFREVINAANTLMQQFGQSSEQATQLISDGMRGMLQGDGPKLLSMIQQFAPSFRDAGIEASQLVAIIQNSEGGIFTDQNMNAIVMGIKNIRLMTNATRDALAALGISGEEMTRKLNEGSMTIFDALRQVSDALQQTEAGSQAAGQVMQQVFGRQGAMAGTNLAKAIATLNTNLEDTKKQTGELGDAYEELYEANVKLNTAIRDCFEYDGWEQMATGIKASLISALASVVTWLGKIKELLGGIKSPKELQQDNENLGGSYIDKAIENLGDGKSPGAKTAYTYQTQEYQKRLIEINQLIKQKEGELTISQSVKSANIAESGVMGGVAQAINNEIQQLKNRKQAVLDNMAEYERRAQDVFNGKTKTDAIKQENPPQPTFNIPKSKKESPQEQARKQVNDALFAYNQSIEKAKMALDNGTSTEAEYKRRMLQAEEQLWGAYGKAYRTYSDPSYKQAQDAAAQKIQELGGEVTKAIEAQQAAQKAARELEQAQKKLADAQREQADALSRGDLKAYNAATQKVTAAQTEVSRLKPADVTQTINTAVGDVKKPDIPEEVTQTINTAVGDVETPDIPAEVTQTINTAVGDVKMPSIPKTAEQKIVFKLTDNNLEAFIADLKNKISEADIGSALYNSLNAQLADATALGNLIETAVKNGIDVAQFDPQTLWQKIFGENPGDYIDDSTWQGLFDSLNKGIRRHGGDKEYTVDTSTGSVSEKEDKNSIIEDTQKVVGGLQQVASGLQQMGVELPDGVSELLQGAQGLISVITGIQTIVELFNTSQTAVLGLNTAALEANAIAMASLTSALWTNTSISMIPFLNAGGIVPKFAGGGVVPSVHFDIPKFAGGGVIGKAAFGMAIPGNSLSGDNLRLPVDGGRGVIGVNSGEVILNRAQAGIVADAISDNTEGMAVHPYVEGETIFLGVNNMTKRKGLGEIVTTSMLRRYGLI